MKLPNGDKAIVDERKLREYLLSSSHQRGKHKARLFAAIGLTAERADLLRAQLLAAACWHEAEVSRADEFGTRYVVRFVVSGPVRSADAVSVWMVASGEGVPRLVTCYLV